MGKVGLLPAQQNFSLLHAKSSSVRPISHPAQIPSFSSVRPLRTVDNGVYGADVERSGGSTDLDGLSLRKQVAGGKGGDIRDHVFPGADSRSSLRATQLTILQPIAQPTIP